MGTAGEGAGSIFRFLWLVLSWKWGQKLGKLSVTNPVLDVRGPLLQGLLFGFLGWWLEVGGESSAFTHGLVTAHLYIQFLTDYPTHVPRSGPNPTCA